MKTGTKSLLFGVHQFILHPITVYVAWVWLYRKLPTFKETICIVIHDWGYWGKANMDDEDGERHPEIGAKIAHALLDKVIYYVPSGPHCQIGDEMAVKSDVYYNLCLLHSRHYARNAGKEPSLLCWADKLSILFDPWWLYLPRALASGELFEYRKIAARTGFIPLTASHREWHVWIRERLSTLGKEKRGDVVPYVNPERIHHV